MKRRGQEQASKVQPPERPNRLILPTGPAEGGLPLTAIKALEGIRDGVIAEEWANPIAKHYVLFGIKLCIQVLRKQDINEIT